jgi:hypothetical protein
MELKRLNRLSWIALWSLSLLSCGRSVSQEQAGGLPTRIKGISYESPSVQVDTAVFTSMQAVQANYVALIPFGFIRKQSSEVLYNLSWQWWGERDEGIRSLTRDAHSKGLEVMIKPQVWIGGGAFTGDYTAGSEAAWQDLERSYFHYIMHFAKLAEEEKAALYCIGTEWKVFMTTRPVFWGQLIDSVRAHYSGKLTYAGNWDSYSSFPHWSKLDYLGIDAYFPISEAQTPTVEEVKGGWEKVKAELMRQQQLYNIPVLFTEYGYRSIDFCAKAPWESGRADHVNLEAQQNAYEGFYQSMWHEPWFAGGFLWKWHSPHHSAGGANNNRYTPQNKPAEAVVQRYYKR